MSYLPEPWDNILTKLFLACGVPFLAVTAGLLLGLYIGSSSGDLPVAKQPEMPSMSQCIVDILDHQEQKNTHTFEKLREARDHCYSFINAQGLLNDYAIRRLNFFQQYRANGILMWMVVAVTFSGVLLAALQLWASYQLAAANRVPLSADSGEITLERDRMVLKSSITGLFILLISFCFFLVFVFYVYKFDASVDHGSAIPQSGPMLPTGGLGAPPAKKDGQ